MMNTHPEWFKKALSIPKEQKSIDVDDGAVHYQHWGDAINLAWF